VDNGPRESITARDCVCDALSLQEAGSKPRRRWAHKEGLPLPLGATWIEDEQAFNFSVCAERAEGVTLHLYSPNDLANPILTFQFDSVLNKSGRIWHCRIPLQQMRDARYYAYSVSGQAVPGLCGFDHEKVLLDPYAKGVFFPPGFDRKLAMEPGPNAGKAPLGILPGHRTPYDWAGDVSPQPESDAIIYELHVKGFTNNPNSGVHPSRAGTYAGLIEKIPYLKDLGITVVELMPIFQRDPDERDYWGYMPLNFFAPHAQYGAGGDDEQHSEFKSMIKALHKAGIFVVLDVVYNHTCEGDHRGPIYSLKGFDAAGYYMPSSDPSNPYANHSGTGNTLNFSQAHVRKMVMDSLRYWKNEMHIDGFRFDLASVFSRNADGTLNWGDAPIFSEIASDPELGRLALIAEPWDVGAYQLGRGFPGTTWLQWNARYRDHVRRFVRGDAGMIPDLMRCIYGSDDLFPDSREHAYHAFQTVNYIDCHDGFTLYDLVSYNQKHNWKNGHDNQDGMDANYSWNCGHEGEGASAEVLALRRKQARNFFCLLMLSNGIPMFRAGDEFLNTQFGNNNPYNQDNEIGWLDWSQLQANPDIFRFFKRMIAFRKSHPSLCRSRFWREDISWYGIGPMVDLAPDSRSLAFCLHGASQDDDDVYVMINAYWEALQFQIQEGTRQDWTRIVDTDLPSPDDFSECGLPLQQSIYQVAPRSIVVLVRAT
jgi:isoamylase